MHFSKPQPFLLANLRFSAKKNGEGDNRITKVENLTVSPPFINTNVVRSFFSNIIFLIVPRLEKRYSMLNEAGKLIGLLPT